MAHRNRQEKLRISNELQSTEGWIFLKEEIEMHIVATRGRINSATEMGDSNKLFAAEAYRMALEYVLHMPEKIKKENTDFFDRLYDRVLSGE